MEKSQSCERNGAPGYDLDDALESEELFDEHFEGLDVAPFGSDESSMYNVKLKESSMYKFELFVRNKKK